MRVFFGTSINSCHLKFSIARTLRYTVLRWIYNCHLTHTLLSVILRTFSFTCNSDEVHISFNFDLIWHATTGASKIFTFLIQFLVSLRDWIVMTVEQAALTIECIKEMAGKVFLDQNWKLVPENFAIKLLWLCAIELGNVYENRIQSLSKISNIFPIFTGKFLKSIPYRFNGFMSHKNYSVTIKINQNRFGFFYVCFCLPITNTKNDTHVLKLA